MNEMTIGEVADQVGVQTSTLRYYESVGLLPKVRRENGRRCYDDSIFPQIRMIQLAQKSGFTIAEIKILQDGFQGGNRFSAGWQRLAADKLVELKQRIYETEQMVLMLQNGLECGCLSLDDCTFIQEGSLP